MFAWIKDRAKLIVPKDQNLKKKESSWKKTKRDASINKSTILQHRVINRNVS